MPFYLPPSELLFKSCALKADFLLVLDSLSGVAAYKLVPGYKGNDKDYFYCEI